MKAPGDKPQWIVQQEEDLQDENARRIQKQLKGKLAPTQSEAAALMRIKYSKYGKRKKVCDEKHDRSLRRMRA